MIQFKSLSKTFQTESGTVQALDNINLSIASDECYGVIGESGAGKSTLLRMINALEEASSGQVLVDGIDIQRLPPKELRKSRQKIAMIFQQFNLLSNLTVEDNILMPLKLHSYEDYFDVNHVLDFVGLADKKHAYPKELSGGQKQRVGIARALITKPKILLCDEPTSALDKTTTDEIVQLLAKINQDFDMTVIIVTHELDVIKHVCERAAIMDQGKIVDVIDVKKVNNPQLGRSYYEQAVEVLTS